jgi:hypothetical protein
VLEGRFGVQLGNDTLEGGSGDLLFKPPGVAHAFWNGGEEPARLLELISPAGFEHYFREMAPLLAATERDQAAIDQVVARYRLDIDFATIPTLAEQHNLRLGTPNQPTGQVVAFHDAAVSAEPDNGNQGAMPGRRRSKHHGAMVRSGGAAHPPPSNQLSATAPALSATKGPSG